MTSLPLDSTHGRKTLGKAFHHRLWAARTVKRRWERHDITALGQHTRLNDVGMACHHHLVAPHTVERRWVWHALGQQTRLDDVRRDMPSLPLDSTHGRTTLSVAFHHCIWAAHTVKLRCAWHDITAFGQHTRSNDVGCGMISSPLGSTHSRRTSCVA